MDNGVSNKTEYPPFRYDFLLGLKASEYPFYLKKIFKYATGDELNLDNPRTFNEKIQWLKLYDCSALKTRLTDKVLVREWVKEKIGSQYLKPLLWIGKSFDEIPWKILPDSFIIKCSHGCGWNHVIKNKLVLLQEKDLYRILKRHFDGWMYQNFFPVAGFELQYKNIVPQLLIEELMMNDINTKPLEIEVYCFNGIPKIIQEIRYSTPREASVYDENFNQINLKFKPDYIFNYKIAEKLSKEAKEISGILAHNFKLARIDWLVYNNKIYFEEITFTPFSGFYIFEEPDWNKKLGDMLQLGVSNNGI